MIRFGIFVDPDPNPLVVSSLSPLKNDITFQKVLLLIARSESRCPGVRRLRNHTRSAIEVPNEAQTALGPAPVNAVRRGSCARVSLNL